MSEIEKENNLTGKIYVNSIITKNAYTSDTNVGMCFTCWSVRSKSLINATIMLGDVPSAYNNNEPAT